MTRARVDTDAATRGKGKRGVPVCKAHVDWWTTPVTAAGKKKTPRLFRIQRKEYASVRVVDAGAKGRGLCAAADIMG